MVEIKREADIATDDIVSTSVLGQPIIILKSAKSASELLEQRSTIYSSRGQLPMISDPEL
jgi:hypothetical protein